MAENPVRRLARLLGGVVLLQGGLGHQVLGQLLVADTNDAVLAGAMLVITGSARQKNIVAQAALRTAAPTLTGLWFLRAKELHLRRREAGLEDRELKRERIEAFRSLVRHRAGRRARILGGTTGVVVLTPPAVPAVRPDVKTLAPAPSRPPRAPNTAAAPTPPTALARRVSKPSPKPSRSPRKAKRPKKR